MESISGGKQLQSGIFLSMFTNSEGGNKSSAGERAWQALKGFNPARRKM